MSYNHTKVWIGSISIAPFFATLLIASPQLVCAQERGDAVAGRQLTETWCSSCHVTDPKVLRGTSNGAPTFASVARMSSTTPLVLQTFLQTPHDRMPDLQLSRDEIDNIIAYILSLRRR